MTDSTCGQQVRSFFDLEADVLDRRFQTIETLLPAEGRRGAAHTGEEGRYIESLLRDFLNRHLPSELCAFSGFILRTATKTGANDLRRVSELDKHSKQLDIIVYDRARYPVYEQFEEFAVVPPEGVIGILSVKKKLYRSQLRPELASLKGAAELCDLPEHNRGPHLGLFAFRAEMKRSNVEWGEEIIQAIQEEMGGTAFNYLNRTITRLVHRVTLASLFFSTSPALQRWEERWRATPARRGGLRFRL